MARPGAGWRWVHLQVAPHRLGFFLAMIVLGASSLWWALVQLDRSGLGPHLAYAISPTATHAAAMTFGFMPLFFAGFLFTAGPKWLAVRPPAARDLLPVLATQAAGWLLWLAGSQLHFALAAVGLLMACGAMVATTVRFWRLIRASRVPDRLHARIIGAAAVAGCASLAGMGLALAFDAGDIARACVLTGLWGFVVVTFVTVAHRMIPFFTSTALPMADAWRPFWALWVLLGAALFQAVAAWVDGVVPDATAWLLVRSVVELAGGLVVVWLAFAWGLVQSLKIRLLAMLHLGFLWFGLGLVLAGGAHAAQAVAGEAMLPLAPLHAVTMGGLGSLMLAMVTRVSCGHSGRPLVADGIVWSLFLLLQAATLARLLAEVPGWPAQPLLLAAAAAWAGLMLVWGVRYGIGYGQLRSDGRAG